MPHLSKAQKSRAAVATFKTLTDALVLQGLYRPSDTAGKKLLEALRQLSPEIYGSMNDPRVVELKGLEYVIDRMPRGIERCLKVVLTAQDDFHQTSFEKRIPLKRRRLSYAVSEDEMCFIITRGASEVYDILTHIVFLKNEAEKIKQQILTQQGELCGEWLKLKEVVELGRELDDVELDKALWNLSKILGRSYKETRETYAYLEESRTSLRSNSGLFAIIYGIGNSILEEDGSLDHCFEVHFTPSLNDMIGHHGYAIDWALHVKKALASAQLLQRPIHIISANMHSFRNLLYGSGYLKSQGRIVPENIYEMVREIRNESEGIKKYASKYGFLFLKDISGSNIDVNIIDTSLIEVNHPSLPFAVAKENAPVLLVMDYAFGTQAFKIMDELLGQQEEIDNIVFDVESISIMGKAGILGGQKGDIMLATAHVLEGTPNNYIVQNDLTKADFEENIDDPQVFTGPMLTVLGTSLQNSDLLKRFWESDWRAVGLEMEGGHYQRAISAAIIQGRIPADLKIRYAYYASDNPLVSGQTLASGPMGEDGIVPTYLITKTILRKIFTA